MGAIVAWAAGVVRIFWVCRVSLLDALVGLAFFGLLVQAQNLMADRSSAGSPLEFTFWAGVFAGTFLLWAFPVHYGARRSLDQLVRMDPALGRRLGWLVLWLPRLLGLAPFAALALGVSGARDAAAGAVGVLGTADATMWQGLWLYVADGITAALFIAFLYLRRGLVPASWTGNILHPGALLVTAAIFGAAYIAPLETAVHVPRALLVPPLFGSLVLVASWLTRVGDRTGFPFLATLALALGILTGLNAHFDDLRTIPGAKDQRLDIAAAAQAWKTANGCNGADCPHPIVIGIDGGASRAAFTAATFVGEMLDRMPPPSNGQAKTPGRRIFAISGVSGGAYGAAVIQSALLDAQRKGDKSGLLPPCQSAQSTWFEYRRWKADDKGNFTWRQCLQALTSGDYLSSTIIGLAFRDFVAPPWQWVGLPPLEDRAAILEMTWERQYAATLVSGHGFFEGGQQCHGADDTGLCRPAAHAGAYVGPNAGANAVGWIPMLLLNGTSVATGRRIGSSDLVSVQNGDLYSQAFDLREAMSSPCPVPEKKQECRPDKLSIDGPDVRLSTAAMTSARFPIISPAGVFTMGSSLYGDQVVDGGYFENSGLTTALDLVTALKTQGLDPVVVSISNNPAFAPLEAQCRKSPSRCTGLPPRPAETPRVPAADTSFVGRFFGLFYRPFQTLVSSGDGHADELIALIHHYMDDRFFHLEVEVHPRFGKRQDGDRQPPPPDPDCDGLESKQITMAKVSMSWWLAAVVQADLDIQRCTLGNRMKLQEIVEDYPKAQ